MAAAALGNVGAQGKAAIPALLEAAEHDKDYFLRGVARAAVLCIDKESAKKSRICESFLFETPQPKLRATISGRFILETPQPILASGKIFATDVAGERTAIFEMAGGKAPSWNLGPADIGWPLALSPDGRKVASSSKDKLTVRLWDLLTGQVLAVLRGHTDRIASLCFSPDGKTLASGSSDKTVRLWDAATGRALNCLEGHTAKIASLAFSPNGVHLATGGGLNDCRVKLWEASTGKEITTFRLDAIWGDVRSLAFSPDGKILATGSGELGVRLFEVPTRTELAYLEGYDDSSWVDSVAFSRDGRTLAAVSRDAVFLWDVATRKNIIKVLSTPDYIQAATFIPDGRMLVQKRHSDASTETLWEFTAMTNGMK